MDHRGHEHARVHELVRTDVVEVPGEKSVWNLGRVRQSSEWKHNSDDDRASIRLERRGVGRRREKPSVREESGNEPRGRRRRAQTFRGVWFFSQHEQNVSSGDERRHEPIRTRRDRRRRPQDDRGRRERVRPHAQDYARVIESEKSLVRATSARPERVIRRRTREHHHRARAKHDERERVARRLSPPSDGSFERVEKHDEAD